MFTRKISAVLRGKVTPFQIAAACMLGAAIGFTPTFATARGLTVALVLLLLVLNANLIVALATASLAKVIALFTVPATFAVGQVLLDGPTQPLFRWAINTPVLALFGFEYYLTTGGLVMAAILGVVLAFVIIRTVAAFRKSMAKLEDASPAYTKFTSKKSVRILTYVLVGKGKGKKSYEDLLGKRIGNPIRIIGVVIALVVGVSLYFAQNVLSERILTAALVQGIEQANGATVDLTAAKLSLRDNKLTLTGLAIADPENLKTDLFRAATIEADVDTTDLLLGRMTLEHVAIADASHGAKRSTPGQLVKRAEADPKTTPSDPSAPPPAGKTLDDYLVKAQEIKDRLQQLKDILDRVQGSSDPATPTDPTTPGTDPKTDPVDPTAGPPAGPSADQIRRMIARLGHARVRADHLVEGAPSLLIRTLDVTGLTIENNPSRTFNVQAQNISTHPWLVQGTPNVHVVSNDDQIDLLLSLASATTLTARFSNLDADAVAAALDTPEPLMRGGTLDATLSATIGPGPDRLINAPLIVNLHNTRLSLPSVGSTDVAEFTLPIEVAGTLSNPNINIDDDKLSQALEAAGANELANALQKELNKALGDIVPDDLGNVGEDLNKAAGDLLKGILGGGG